jgi:hypothetical protein
MKTRGISLRNIVLVILFVMILICSLLSVSYSYYTSSAANSNSFVKSNTIVPCLSISYYFDSVYQNSAALSSLPAYLFPVDQHTVLQDDTPCLGPYGGSTCRAYGDVAFHIHNNCSTQTYFDVAFIPMPTNSVDPSNFWIAYCNSSMLSCANSPSQFYSSGGMRHMGQRCFNPSSATLSAYFKTLYWEAAKTTLDPKICSIGMLWNYPGFSIGANETKYITFRYWITEGATVSPGDAFVGKFIVYTVDDSRNFY